MQNIISRIKFNNADLLKSVKIDAKRSVNSKLGKVATNIGGIFTNVNVFLNKYFEWNAVSYGWSVG